MPLNYNTQVLNFFLACFKRIGFLKKALYEESINLEDDVKVTPDLLCFFTKEDGANFYSVYEFKHRSIEAITERDLEEELIPQYQKYRRLQVSHLDQNLIPKIITAEMSLNYVFINTEREIIQDIIDQVPIQEDTSVYSLNLKNKTLKVIQASEGTENFTLMERVIELSTEREFWKKIYVSFTLEDIVGIKGLGGPKIDIPRFAGAIITNKFVQFIVNRKITERDSNFNADDFMDFIFKEFFKVIHLGEDQKKGFKRKLIMYLDWFARDLIEEINLTEVIRRLGTNQYRIIIRNTSTLEERCIEIRKRAITFFQQMKITEFFD